MTHADPYRASASSRRTEFVAVWNTARRRLLSFGVGMSQVAKEERLIRDTIARGVEVHIVMVDPSWVLGSRTASTLFDSFYNQKRFGERFREAHSTLGAIALDVNERLGAERLRIHTYRSMIPQSVTIADPGDPAALGILELHAYGRPADRARTSLPGTEGRNLLDPTLRSVSHLVGHDFTRENPDSSSGSLPGLVP